MTAVAYGHSQGGWMYGGHAQGLITWPDQMLMTE